MELDTLDENGNYNDGHIATLLESKGSIAVFALLLLDSGACNSFISLQLVEELELPLRELRHAFTMRSASGTHITGKLCTCEIVFQRLMLAHGFSCCSYVTSVDTWFAFSTSLLTKDHPSSSAAARSDKPLRHRPTAWLRSAVLLVRFVDMCLQKNKQEKDKGWNSKHKEFVAKNEFLNLFPHCPAVYMYMHQAQ